MFVETEDGIIPLLGVSPLTSISDIKHRLEELTAIPVSHQLLSCLGRVMHDEFLIRDFNGLHKIHEDSVIDLCKTGTVEARMRTKSSSIITSLSG